MVLDTETVFLLHFKAEIWREREFDGGHFEFQDGRQLYAMSKSYINEFL